MLRLLIVGVDTIGFVTDSALNSFWSVLELVKCATYYVFFSECILVSLRAGSYVFGCGAVPKSTVFILYRFYRLARFEVLTLTL